MKKTFELFVPETLSFKKKTVDFPPDFITGYSEPIPPYATIGLGLIKNLQQVLREDLPQQHRTFLENCVVAEILPYLFCYQFEDNFKDYGERRDWYIKLEKTDKDLHEVLSNNKYRKRRIESVLRYAKHFAGTQETIRVRTLVETHYNLDNPYKFQTEDWNFKYKIAEAVCELTVMLTKDILQDVRQKIAA
mgnify:CR=1 FL=1